MVGLGLVCLAGMEKGIYSKGKNREKGEAGLASSQPRRRKSNIVHWLHELEGGGIGRGNLFSLFLHPERKEEPAPPLARLAAGWLACHAMHNTLPPPSSFFSFAKRKTFLLARKMVECHHHLAHMSSLISPNSLSLPPTSFSAFMPLTNEDRDREGEEKAEASSS